MNNETIQAIIAIILLITNFTGLWYLNRAHPVPGCAPGVRLDFTPPGEEGDSVGGQGGWGGIYCFALEP